MPKLLARFKVNTTDTLAVFKAVSKEDFKDVRVQPICAIYNNVQLECTALLC